MQDMTLEKEWVDYRLNIYYLYIMAMFRMEATVAKHVPDVNWLTKTNDDNSEYKWEICKV